MQRKKDAAGESWTQDQQDELVDRRYDFLIKRKFPEISFRNSYPEGFPPKDLKEFQTKNKLNQADGAQLESDILDKYERIRKTKGLPAKGIIPFKHKTAERDENFKWSQDEEMDYQRTRLQFLERRNRGGRLGDEEKFKLCEVRWFMLYELQQRVSSLADAVCSEQPAKLAAFPTLRKSHSIANLQPANQVEHFDRKRILGSPIDRSSTQAAKELKEVSRGRLQSQRPPPVLPTLVGPGFELAGDAGGGTGVGRGQAQAARVAA